MPSKVSDGADTAPHLLSADLLERVAIAKQLAARRQEIESRLPNDMLFSKNWPFRMPTHDEAALLAEVRRDVGQLLGLEVQCTTAETFLARYAELLAAKSIKAAKKAGRPGRARPTNAGAPDPAKNDAEASSPA